MRVSGFGSLGFTVLGFRAQGFGFRLWGLAFRARGFVEKGSHPELLFRVSGGDQSSHHLRSLSLQIVESGLRPGYSKAKDLEFRVFGLLGFGASRSLQQTLTLSVSCRSAWRSKASPDITVEP